MVDGIREATKGIVNAGPYEIIALYHATEDIYVQDAPSPLSTLFPVSASTLYKRAGRASRKMPAAHEASKRAEFEADEEEAAGGERLQEEKRQQEQNRGHRPSGCTTSS
ncbi:hypothetical protein HZH68_009825 [Vespula germanica]|uniref:Uncharacterized protein n=1 Tax=Vespula germanica TaxID=30212 RepID=A0A834N3U0_VESGE|nr:hypothetical protein HZH68_009825 [Vespula germanica]